MKIANHRLQGAPYKASPNVGGSLSPVGIVLHSTDGDIAGTGSINWLTDKRSAVSAHVVIDREGLITQLVPFNKVAWHAGKSQWKGLSGINSYAVGIEFANPGRLTQHDNNRKFVNGLGIKVEGDLAKEVVWHEATNAHAAGFYLPLSEKQLAAGIDLSRALAAQYPIQWIATHWQISPGRKTDFNPTLDVKAFSAQVLNNDHNSDTNSGYVKINGLNVRALPDSTSKILTELRFRTKVEVVDTEFNGSTKWLLVNFTDPSGSRSGWVAARYVDLD